MKVDESFFGKDVDGFRPERFLDEEECDRLIHTKK